MERIKNLNFYQKGTILLMLLMSVIFAVIYPMTISRMRYLYNDTILVPKDENGNVIDPMEPSAGTIYELMNTPELTHKGEGLVWFGGVCICILNILSVLFADELFRWNLMFQIQNVEDAKPSEWQIAERYISWTVLALVALIVFIIGLQ